MTTVLSGDQLRNLRGTAHAFAMACDYLARMYTTTRPTEHSGFHLGLVTGYMATAGLAIELHLKTLMALAGQPFPHTHVLVDLYDDLPSPTQRRLDAQFRAFAATHLPRETRLGRAVTRRASPPVPRQGASYNVPTLRGVLSLFDDDGLFSRLYSFEAYARSESFSEVKPDVLVTLLDAFTQWVDDEQAVQQGPTP